MRKREFVHLPLENIRQLIENQEYKKAKYFLVLFFDFEKHHRNGWDLDDLAKIVKHQKAVVESLIPSWLEDGWLQTYEFESVVYYCLKPSNLSESLIIPKKLFNCIKQNLNSIDFFRWLWLQLHQTDKITEKELANVLKLERLSGVHRILKNLESAHLLTFDVTNENEVIYELDYFECKKEITKDNLSINIETLVKDVKEVEIPLRLLEWMKTSNYLMISKLYSEWLLFLIKHHNHYFSINELTKSVFSLKHYNSIKKTLQEMINQEMIIVKPTDHRQYQLVQPKTKEVIRLDVILLKKALNQLSYREFALWLNLQLCPIDEITTHDVLERLNCKNKTQARNILKRLSESDLIELKKSPSTRKKRIVLKND